MADVITSAYDQGLDVLSVESMMADPTFIPQRVTRGLTNAFVEELFFRKAGNNKGAVAFREAAAQAIDEAETVAEFAEIPVSDPNLGKVKTAYGTKIAEGIRVSYEQRYENRIDAVNTEIQDVQKKVVRKGFNLARRALDNADVQELVIDTAWNRGGSVVDNIYDSIEMVQGAQDDRGGQYDYDPDTILLHPRALTAAVRNEEMKKSYIGNAALENPIFKGLKEMTLMGTLRVATSRLIPVGEAFVFEKGAPGFISDTIPLTTSPMYSERGDSPLGGSTMSWRTDVVLKRAIGIDNPKSVVKLTGVIA